MANTSYPINDNNSVDGEQRFLNFFMEKYRDELQQLLQAKNKEIWHSLHFNFVCLLAFDEHLGAFLMAQPSKAFEWANKALLECQIVLYDQVKQAHRHLLQVKDKCRVRLRGTLWYPNSMRPTVSSIRSQDVGRLVQMPGTVIRQSKSKLLEYSRAFVCLTCKRQWTVTTDESDEKDILYPKSCTCKSTHIQSVEGSKILIDFQEIFVQDQVQKLEPGTIPRRIRVVLLRDLSGACQPGDDIEVIGVVRYHWNTRTVSIKRHGKRFDISMYIDSVALRRIETVSSSARHSVKLSHVSYQAKFDKFWTENGAQPIRARNMILANLCPQLSGMYVVKQAVALTMIGGMARQEFDVRIRGQSHLLLVGDPGTGKSQLLRYAAQMATRAVVTTGIGTTSAGLTVSAVRDGGEWVLEAGALVLADGGICCIDEFGSVREHDRGVIHEAMEQQTISVAKGGFVCSLNSRTTVLAAMNPPSGSVDQDSNMSLNTCMASSLLGRFDVILLLVDQRNAAWDRKVGRHLMAAIPAPVPAEEEMMDVDDNTLRDAHHGYDSTASLVHDVQRYEDQKEERVHWTVDEMQAYFSIVRSKTPWFTAHAQEILSRYYQLQRLKQNRDKARTTIRLLESLIRLATAHARLMYRDRVLAMDAIQAVHLMEKSLKSTFSLSDYGVLQTAFPVDAQQEYEQEKLRILQSIDATECDDHDAHDYKAQISENEQKMTTEVMQGDDAEGSDIEWDTNDDGAGGDSSRASPTNYNNMIAKQDHIAAAEFENYKDSNVPPKFSKPKKRSLVEMLQGGELSMDFDLDDFCTTEHSTASSTTSELQTQTCGKSPQKNKKKKKIFV